MAHPKPDHLSVRHLAARCRFLVEAKVRWLELVEESKAGGVPCDNLGPKKKPLRLAVTVSDTVVYSNEFKRAQMVEMQERAVKNATAEDVDKAVNRAVTHHDNAHAAEVRNMGVRMVTAGPAGRSFDAVNMKVGVLQDLVDDAEEPWL